MLCLTLKSSITSLPGRSRSGIILLVKGFTSCSSFTTIFSFRKPLVPTVILLDYSILTSDNSPREHLSIYWRVAWVSSSETRTFLCSMLDSITSTLQMDDVTRSLLLPSASYLPPVSQGSLYTTSLLSRGRCGGDTISAIDQRGNHSLFLLGLI